jgi:hypothetical protein
MRPFTFTDHRIAPIPCPGCDACLDGATNVFGDGGPTEGSLTVCSYCGKILVFTEDPALGLKVAEREDLKDAPADVLLALLLASSAAKRLRHRRN